MRARDLNWLQVEAYLTQDDRVVLPVGSTEQHGYLSLETDNILAERVSAEDQTEQARRDVSESCPPDSGTAQKPSETPANPHSPIVLPRISFMISSVPPPIGPRRASRTARSMPYSRM